jgi:hypothetical protein
VEHLCGAAKPAALRHLNAGDALQHVRERRLAGTIECVAIEHRDLV